MTALIRQIAGDEELRDRLLAADETERAAIVSDLGFTGITQADIAAGASAVASEMTAEIDESEFENLAGGNRGVLGCPGCLIETDFPGHIAAVPSERTRHRVAGPLGEERP